MRVALVCPYDLDLPGGVQNQSLGLAAALVRRGHEVVLLAPGKISRHLPTGLSLALLGPSIGVSGNGSVAPIAPFPTAIAKTHRLLHHEVFDIVHLQEPFVPGPCLVALLWPPAPVVGTFHRAGVGRAYRALSPVLRRLVSRIDRRVAVSRAAAETLAAVSGASVSEILANAVDLERFKGSVRRGGPPRLVFVGRHEHRKGLRVLLEAVVAMPGEFELRVVGTGPETGPLQAQFLDRRITWLGRLDDDAVTQVLSESDVFVAPSLYGESFGVVLLEAMAAGCAVIAADLPGYRLAGEEAVRYFRAGDAAALRVELCDLLGDTTALTAQAAQGRELAKRHSFTLLAERYELLYQELAGRR